MRVDLFLAALLLSLPPNIYGSKEKKKLILELENRHINNVSVGMGFAIEDNISDKISSAQKMKTKYRREAAELSDKNYIDYNDYNDFPPCGDKRMYVTRICYCGNITLSGFTDLQEGDQYCCVPPSKSGQCKYSDNDPNYSDVRCANGKVMHKIL